MSILFGKQMINIRKPFFFLFFSVLFFSSFTWSDEEDSNYLLRFKNKKVIQAIITRSVSSYLMEMENLIKAPAREILEISNGGKDLPGSDLFNILIDLNSRRFDYEAWDFLVAFTPPLGKKDREGRTALKVAKDLGNWRIYDTIYRLNNKANFELDKNDMTNIWSRNIPIVELEKTEIGKALINSDFETFAREIDRLISSAPAYELLSFLHSRTSNGETPFHLIAKVKRHEEKFASKTKEFMEFVLIPDALFWIKKAGDSPEHRFIRMVSSPDSRQKISSFLKKIFGYGATGLGLGVMAFTPGGENIVGMGIVGAGLCLLSFRGKEKTKP